MSAKSAPGRLIAEADRMVSRGRGCYNCVSFCNDKSARTHWHLHRTARVAEIEARTRSRQIHAAVPSAAAFTASELARGLPDHIAAEQAVAIHTPREDARLTLMRQVDRGVLQGAIGLCLKGKAGSDFVYSTFLCDGWSGRTGASVATGGAAGKIDKLPGELREIADGKARKR